MVNVISRKNLKIIMDKTRMSIVLDKRYKNSNDDDI